MDDQARAIGQRVRYWRTRRDLDRQRFADMVGRSTSWLDKIEKGERNLLRLPMLERVAAALGIDASALTDSGPARRAADCIDTVEVQAIRAALSRYPSLTARCTDRPAVTSAHVTRQLTYVEHAWTSSHFTVVSRHLPRLLDDALAVASNASTADQVAAHRALVTAYRLASSVLLKFGANDIAWLAADRAIHAAMTVDDTLALARATRSVARAMSSSGQRDDAISVLICMADRIRRELSTRERELLSPYGMLFLAGAVIAARNDDGALALEMHEEAEAAAGRIESQHEKYGTSFGQANVAVHRVAALVRLREGGQALEYDRAIAPALICTLSQERHANYLLDLAEAYIDNGHYNDAVRTLTKVEIVAPEEVRCRPLAHGLVRTLAERTTGETGRLVRHMATRAGVTA